MATISPTAANTVQSLNANFKEVYGELKDLVPNNVKLTKMVPFAKGDKQMGNALNEPVILGLEGGFTYGGTEGLAFALNDISSFPLKNARVKSSELVLRSAISVATASRSVTQKNAFERGMKLLTGNMLKSMFHRLEISLHYGQEGIGAVESLTGTTVINVADAEWAAGIWVGLSKAKIDIFDVTLATKRLTATIQSYDLLNKTVTVAEDLAAAGVVATDVIYFEGAYDVSDGHKDMKGLHSIALERTSLFEIPNANEPLFQGNIVDVGTDATSGAAVISFKKIEEAVARAVEKGLSEEEISVEVNVNSWNDLLSEQVAKRMFDSSYSSSQYEEGARSLKFHGQAGMIEIIPTTYVKEGYAYAFCKKDLIRIGSSDVTFDPPGYEGEYFKMLENANGYEIRAYSDQALFTSRPGCITILRYIKRG